MTDKLLVHTKCSTACLRDPLLSLLVRPSSDMLPSTHVAPPRVLLYPDLSNSVYYSRAPKRMTLLQAINLEVKLFGKVVKLHGVRVRG
jgi:hypothetical protein